MTRASGPRIGASLACLLLLHASAALGQAPAEPAPAESVPTEIAEESAENAAATADATGAANQSATDTWGTASPEPPPAPFVPEAPLTVPSPCPCAQNEPEGVLGPVRYTLERVAVRGNTRTRKNVVMRYVPFRKGDLIDVSDSAFELLRFRLLGTGFFRDVDMSLEKGSARGQVVLVIQVVERNTIVLNDVAIGISKTADVQGPNAGEERPISAYAGIDIAETNLAGSGITLGAAAAVAQDQLALRMRFLDPAFLGSSWMISGQLLYNNAHDFFGNAGTRWADPTGDLAFADFAVVAYKRFGGTLGLGRDLSVSTQVWLHYRLESIDASFPRQASHLRGFDREPIAFDVIRGKSVLSTLRGTLQHDTRDHPFLPTRGWLVTASTELALLPAALDYDYQKAEIHAQRWWPLPVHGHVVKLDLYGGAIAGNAPFFERFYVGDLSDFLPDRVLGMNFDRRPPPNFLGTQIVEERYASYALKLSGEYRVPLYRGRRSIYGIDIFASAGLYGLADNRTITDPPTGYSGLARIPVDLTGNLGFRADTSAGGFTFAFANLLGFPLRGQGPAGE
jgi:outer membrane protein insertion porin family